MKRVFQKLLLMVLTTHGLFARPEILFVGNSFTHGHADPAKSYHAAGITDANGTRMGGVPGIFKRLAELSGYPCEVTIEAVGGRAFDFHLKKHATLIADSRWDVVVLQDHSTHPLPSAHGGHADAFLRDGDALHDLVLVANPDAKVLLYQTWASPTSAGANGYGGDLRAMQADLSAAYERLRRRSARAPDRPDFAGVVPVGDAFGRAVAAGIAAAGPDTARDPDTFYLWSQRDHRHAGKHGSYLAAVLFFARIAGVDPLDLPADVAVELGITPIHADQIHRLAHEMIPTAALTTSPTPQPQTVSVSP